MSIDPQGGWVSPTAVLTVGHQAKERASIEDQAVAVAHDSAADQLENGGTAEIDSASAKKRKPPRDGFLDTVRTIALIRVILWHAFGIPWISWFIATMPTMFFIAGSLLASTLDRKPLQVMYRARLKRLLVPYWFFAGCVLSFLATIHLMNPRLETALRVDQILPWLLPFTDPTASLWEAGWASSPLWYLRAYLWLLVLSPILRAAVRRFGVFSLLPALFSAGAIEYWLHNPDLIGANPGTWTWMLGELALYSFFLMLGFLHYDGAFERQNRVEQIEWALIGIVGCVVWWSVLPAPTGIINHSFVGLLFIGIFWLSVFLLLRPILSKGTENAISGPIVYLFNRRAMSIYLWHSPSIALGYWLIDTLAPEAHVTAVLVPTALVLYAAILATGWIEDVSAGKSPELWPRRDGAIVWRSPWVNANGLPSVVCHRHGAGLASGVVVALIASALIVSPTSDQPRASTSDVAAAELPPAPSGRPGVADFGGETGGEGETALPPAPSGRPGVADFGTETSTNDAAIPESLAMVEETDLLTPIIQAWLDEYDVAGARVAVNLPDRTMISTAVGEQRGVSLSPSDVVPLTSATKSVTAAIILDLVDQGLLTLDAPIPPIEAVPSFTHSVTVRQLLNHSAGVAPYQESVGFSSAEELLPAGAVQLSAGTPLQWDVGTERGYSNSGYLILGLLAEQVTGQTFGDLADEQAIALGLSTLRMDNTIHNGWVGSSAGGMVGTVEELALWGSALYRDGEVLSPAALESMVTVDDMFGVGLGAFPVCPCGTSDDGLRTYTSIGHNGGEVSVQYSPADGTVIAVSLTESLWTPFLNEQNLYELLADIRAAL